MADALSDFSEIIYPKGKTIDQADMTPPSSDKESSDDDDDRQIHKDLSNGERYWKLVKNGVEPETNEKLAVEWYLKAAMRGDDSAVSFLRERQLAFSIGITDKNREDINFCRETSSMERKIRHAAGRLFSRVNTARTDIMNLVQYNGAVDALALSHVERNMLMSVGKRIGDVIKEKDFVDAVSDRVQGKFVAKRTDAESKASVIGKVSKETGSSLKSVMDKSMDYVTESGSTLITSIIPVDQVYLILSLIAYSFVSSTFLFMIVPLAVFYVSAPLLFIATVQMVNGQRKLTNMKLWSDMMFRMKIGVDIETAKSQFCMRSLRPYMLFFGSLFVVLVSFSVADKTWIPCSEFCVISAGMSVLTFVALKDIYDYLLPISLSCNVIASLPAFFSNLPDIPVLTLIINFISKPWFSFPVGSFIQFNIGLPTILYMIIPVFFLIMAMRNSWHGTYRILVPHLVCYFWWNLTAIIFPYTTNLGFVRATVGYLFLPVLIPLFILIIAYYSFTYFLQLIQTANFAKILITLILLGFSTLLYKSKLFAKKSKKGYEHSTLRNVLLVTFGLLSVIPLTFIKLPTSKPQRVSTLTHEKFSASCQAVTEEANSVNQQMICQHLIGIKVNWVGEVSKVKVTSIENSYDSALNSLPKFLSEPLKCVYGEEYNCTDSSMITDASEIDKSKQQTCDLITETHRECHLHMHDLFKFQLDVKMADGNMVKLVAGNTFKNTLQNLVSQDRVNFTAIFEGNLGLAVPSLKLKKISCVNRDLPYSVEVDAPDILMERLNEMITVVLHFFLFPVLEYVPGDA